MNEQQLVATLKSLRAELLGCLAEAKAYHALELKNANDEHDAALEAAEAENRAANERLTAAYQQACESAESAYQRTTDEANNKLREDQQTIRKGVDALLQQWGLLAAPWGDPGWQSYVPSLAATPPKTIRIGELRQSADEDRYPALTVPTMIPLTGSTEHIVFLARGRAKPVALEAMQAVCLRLLTAFAPGDVQFTFIDPVGLGNNAAGFMRLSELFRGAKAWTEADQIRRQLEDLTAHMEMVFQKYLTNEFATIEAYNTKAGLIAEPYRFLVIANFPTNFTEDTANRLLSVAANGPRTGVHIVTVIDADQLEQSRQAYLRGFVLNDLLRVSTVIEAADDGAWHLGDMDKTIGPYRLTLDTLPTVELTNKRIIDPINEHANRIRERIRVEFDEIVPEIWKATSTNGLTIPIGRLGAQQVQLLDLGKGSAQHALVAGKTGMGKSILLHTIVTGLAWAYAPEELELYLIDGKAGVEFKDYADQRLPHARVIAIQSEREFALSVLRGLDVEMKRRADEEIKGYQNLPNYREKTDQPLARILLVIDEFQDLFSDDDAIAIEAAQILSRLVFQGRGFGIHVLMASQTLASAKVINRVVYDQMGVRIALQCSEDDSALILGSNNLAARALTRRGEAIYNAVNGLLEGNTEFQVANLAENARRERLDTLQKRADQIGWQRRPVIFEGNALAHLDANQEFQELIDAPVWPIVNGRGRPKLWLGEPMELKPATAARLRRQSAVNLMLIGQDERTAFALLTTVVLSLCAQHNPQTARFYLVNLASYDQSWAENLATLHECLPHPMHVLGTRGIADLVIKVAETVKTRIEQQQDGDTAALDESIYLVIAGLQTARELRRTDDYTPSPQSEALSQVLRDGPEVGVHTFVWVNTYANAEQVLGSRDFTQFCLKVALQMSQEDSRRLLNEAVAANLGSFRAYFVDEDAGGKLEKFRPYELLSVTDIRTWAERLTQSRGKETS